MYDTFKRLADFCVALLATALLSWLLIPIILVLRFTGEGEVFYRQRRLGYRNRYFGILKFATMLKDSPNIGTGFITLRRDPRVTPAGRLLRITKLNELPQIFNVLLGDMSLVGPRPLMDESMALYSPELRETLYHNRPGITGLGSVVFRDEEELVSEATELGIDAPAFYRHAIYPYKEQLERYYAARRGFWVDFKILLATALAILLPRVDWARKFFPDLPPEPRNLNPKTYRAAHERP